MTSVKALFFFFQLHHVHGFWGLDCEDIFWGASIQSTTVLFFLGRLHEFSPDSQDFVNKKNEELIMSKCLH